MKTKTNTDKANEIIALLQTQYNIELTSVDAFSIREDIVGILNGETERDDRKTVLSDALTAIFNNKPL